jgi:shikimate dehydrogenase
MHISGHTKPFAVLGHPIGHTLSPAMHNASLQALKLDAIYLAFDVPPDRLMEVLPALKTMGFGGVNLTIPLKEVAFRGLPELDESARLLGSVNTVQFTPAGMIGHNTDGHGFLKTMDEEFKFNPRNAAIFVLGTGGAGRAVALTCASRNAKIIWLRDVDEKRAQTLAGEIRDRFPKTEVKTRGNPSEAEVVVQATPVGMKAGDVSPLPPSEFHAGQLAFDLVYMYPETPFMAAARAGGAKAANGLGMLLHQGAQAFRIWTGTEPRVDKMRTALEQAVYKK